MRLLFIAPADLGETVLATGVLAWTLARMDAPRATIVCTPPAAELFRALPQLEKVRPWSGPGFGAALSLARGLSGEVFDLALDLSGAGLARLVRAERRVMRRRRSVQLRHRLEEWAELVGADGPQPPKLWLDARARAEAASETGPLIALAPGADAPGKRWPAERFAAVARRLANGPLAEARVVLLGGSDDAENTRTIAQSLDADGVNVRDLAGRLDLLAQAALLQHATCVIGNDGPQVLLAAAMNAPTLGLYGASDERIRGPRGSRARALRGRAYEAVMAVSRDPLEDDAAMRDLSVDVVEAAAADLLRAGGLS